MSESLKLTIDTTPPIAGRAIILDNLHTSVYVGTMFITIRIDSFYDPESGIGYFQVGLGSKEGFTDIIPLTKVYENTVEWNLDDYDLHNGHKIFLTTLVCITKTFKKIFMIHTVCVIVLSFVQFSCSYKTAYNCCYYCCLEYAI